MIPVLPQERPRRLPKEFYNAKFDVTNFDFSKNTRIKNTRIKNVNLLVLYFGWQFNEEENRISKESKVNLIK